MAAFDATILPTILDRADRLWMDNQVKSQFEAKTDVFQALKKEQTAKIDTALQGKDRAVKVGWITACNIVAADCDTSCTIGGQELDTAVAEYDITSCKKVAFKVPEQKFRDNLFDYTEVVAAGILKGMKELDETISAAGVAFLNANGGENAYASPLWTVASGITNIPAANMTLGLMFHFKYGADQNRFSDAALISGYNLAEPIFIAETNAGNDAGKGDAARSRLMRLYQDFFNIEKVNTSGSPAVTSYKTYMVDKGAVAFASKSYYDPAPRTLPGIGHVLFSRPSNNLPGVVYDVTYTVTCTSGVYFHEYKIEAHYDYFLNPTGCVAGRTGILEFLKV